MWSKVILAILFVVGTGVTGGGFASATEKKPAPPAGYRVELNFASAVPERYYVLSGPGASYTAIPVNALVRKALEEYAGRSSRDSAAPVVLLGVHLDSVDTYYEQLGASRSNGTGGLIRLAGWRRAFAEDRERDRDGPSIPEKITKSVVFTMGSEVAGPGGPSRKASFHVSARIEVDRDHLDTWAYRYDDVMEAAAQNAAVEVDRVLRDALK